MKPFGDRIDWGNEARRVEKEANVFYTHTDGDEFATMIKKWVPDRYGKKVVDCGCNIGRWSDYLVSLGFDYTGIDQSFDALEIARKLRPGYRYVHTFLWDFHCLIPTYDAAIFVAVLQHNTHAEKERVMEMLQQAIKPNGMVFIMESTVKVQTPTQLTQAGWLDLFARYGFTCVDRWHVNELGVMDRYVFKKGA